MSINDFRKMEGPYAKYVAIKPIFDATDDSDEWTLHWYVLRSVECDREYGLINQFHIMNSSFELLASYTHELGWAHVYTEGANSDLTYDLLYTMIEGKLSWFPIVKEHRDVVKGVVRYQYNQIFEKMHIKCY